MPGCPGPGERWRSAVKSSLLPASTRLFLFLCSVHPGAGVPRLESWDLLRVFSCVDGYSRWPCCEGTSTGNSRSPIWWRARSNCSWYPTGVLNPDSSLASRTVTLYISVIWATCLSTLVWQRLQTHVLGKQPGQSCLKRPAGDVESSGNATPQCLKRAPYLCLHCPKTNENGMPLMVTRSWTFVSKLRCLHELLPVYPLRIRKFGVRFSWPELGQVEVRSVVKWDRLEAP